MKKTFLFSILFLITSCNPFQGYKNTTVEIDYVPEVFDQETLIGDWASACETTFDPNSNINFKKRRFLTVKESMYFSLKTKYYENSCDDDSLWESESFGFMDIKETDINIRDLNIEWGSTYLKISSPESIDFANLITLCEQEAWILEEKQNISGSNCNRNLGLRNPPAEGSINYNLFFIYNDELQLGDSSLHSILYINKRPQSLDLASFARFKN